MELRHLRYLIAVAEEHSIISAAHRLSLAQPALSRQVRDLERDVGVTLLSRNSSGSHLTPAGEAAVRDSRAIIADLAAAVTRARAAECGLVGKCVVGVAHYPMWNGLLAQLVEQVAKEFPGIEIVVDERELRAQWNALAAGEICVALGTAPPHGDHPFDIETHSMDVLDAVTVARSHRLASRAAVSLDDLEPDTWLRYAPDNSDEATLALESMLGSAGFHPKNTRFAESDEALRILVRAGAGWAATPRTVRSAMPRTVVTIPIAGFAAPFRYVFMHRRSDDRPLLRSVLLAMRHAAQRANPGVRHEPLATPPLPSLPRPIASWRMELRHLRYFVAAIEHETIGRAAEHVGISQPALSRQLRDLEQDVGATLLVRTARGIAPTLAGEVFHSDVVRILQRADHMTQEAQRADRAASGRCVVGMSPLPLVWDVMTRTAISAGTRFEIGAEDVPTARQAAGLREGRLDLAVGQYYPSLSDLDSEIARVPLMSDALCMALVSEDHPLAEREEVELREIGELPLLFIKRAFSPNFYDRVMSSFAGSGYTPRVDRAFDSLPTAWALAAQKLGWCLGTEFQQQIPPAGIVAIRLKDFHLPGGCEVAYRRDESRPAVIEVIRAIEDSAVAMTREVFGRFQRAPAHEAAKQRSAWHDARKRETA